MQNPTDILEVVAESAVVEKRDVVTGKVRVKTLTEIDHEMVSAVLSEENVTVNRVPVNRYIDSAPDLRVENGVTIIPVVEEVLVVEKRLVLREEIHVRRSVTHHTVEESVDLRRQRVEVQRDGEESQPIEEDNEMTQFTEGGYRTLSAFFDSQGDAERATERLIEAGIPRGDIQLVPGYESDAPLESRSEQRTGFFSALADFFFPEEDRYSYAEGLTRGGFLVVVNNLASELHDTALDILDDEGSIDLDEREESWRSEGWSAYADSNTASFASTNAGATTGTYDANRSAEFSGDGLSSAGYVAEGDEEVVPVVDERLVVGKRDVDLGRVRVRSYTREQAVSADVTLHQDRVTIDRRPVDRPLTDADAAFRDRTIEAEERAEEAVIGKEARVVEEVSLRREGTDHTETISDTVRKTEVEIEDDRTSDSQRINER